MAKTLVASEPAYILHVKKKGNTYLNIEIATCVVLKLKTSAEASQRETYRKIQTQRHADRERKVELYIAY